MHTIGIDWYIVKKIYCYYFDIYWVCDESVLLEMVIFAFNVHKKILYSVPNKPLPLCLQNIHMKVASHVLKHFTPAIWILITQQGKTQPCINCMYTSHSGGSIWSNVKCWISLPWLCMYCTRAWPIYRLADNNGRYEPFTDTYASALMSANMTPYENFKLYGINNSEKMCTYNSYFPI